MKPDRIYDLLFEAGPDELRGVGAGEVARLVRERQDVRALADRILEGLADADETLHALAARSPTPRRSRARLERAPLRLRPRLAVGLTIAAIATVLLRSAGEPPRRGADSVADGEGLAAGLAAGSDRPFAVFETENPDIVVVWLFPEEETR